MFMGDFLRWLAGNAYGAVPHHRHAVAARRGVPPHRCLRHLEDGAPATHVRYAVNVRLLCGYVEIVTHAVLRRYTSPATHVC